MFRKFCKDPNYLMKYHLAVGTALFVINIFLFKLMPPNISALFIYVPAILLMTSTELKYVMTAVVYSWFVSFFQEDFNILYMALILPALVLMFPFTSWIHSPAHDSIKPKWINRPLGELIGIIQLTGFADWKVLHVFHHQYPDDPNLDPHPPLQKSYWRFAFGMRENIGKCYMAHYFRYFGQNELSLRRLKMFLHAAKFNMLMKVGLWYLIMGPQVFSFYFTTSILLKMLHYAWFNYATHKYDSNLDKYNILNLDNAIYKIINKISFGLYYHGNHHQNPSYHNPKYIGNSKMNLDDAA